MKVHEAVQLAEEILERTKYSGYYFLLAGWKITTNNRKRAFGVCSYGKMEIQLSTLLIPYMTDEAIKDTIIHEIAHAITKGHNHDRVWKQKCIELGGNGRRTGGSDHYKLGDEGGKQFREKTAKYILVCPTCGSKIYRNRKPKRKISCANHGNYFDPQHQFKITQNY